MLVHSRGFTFIELLITLSIVSILLGIGIPNLTENIRHSRVKTAAQSMIESLEVTRSNAVFSNKRTTIQKLTNWEDGWEVFVDTNNNGSRDPGEQALQMQSKLNGVRVIANKPLANYVSFIGSGEGRYANGTSNAGGFQAGTFTLCPTSTGKGYELILSRGGRVRQQEISAQDCAAI